MPETDIGSMDASNITTQFANQADVYVDPTYKVDSIQTDGPADQEETTYTQEKFTEYLGYYKTIPELGSCIDARATWTVGKGYKAGKFVQTVLSQIRGFGKDTFNTILENMIRTMMIAGDSFAEIIRNEKQELINLKPLDPGVIRIVVNRQGIIKRYEQLSKTRKKQDNKVFQPDEIFHLCRNRVADEIHGVSVIEKVEQIILMRNEAMADWKRVLHRNVDPMFVFHLDTDDIAEIAAFKSKMDAARAKGENLYVPKDVITPEFIGTAPNASLNPLQWIDKLNDYFYEVCGTPKVIMGGGTEFTEASAKIVYLAFQQSVEEDQLYIEEEVGMQLGLEIELEFPVSLENDVLSDKAKDGPADQAAQPSDTTVGAAQPAQPEGGGEPA